MGFNIKRLSSGGLITNYYCTSRCGHCLYACGPSWPKQYIKPDVAEKCLQIIKKMGCSSIHIGGGEPFLNPEGLMVVLDLAAKAGVGIEYVETNSSWFRDPESAGRLLNLLREHGLRRLLVSMSPFHNEHIPFQKVKGVLAACDQTGMAAMPWIPAFYPELDALDDHRTHNLSEFEERFGPRYLRRLPSRYWVHFGGRALSTFQHVFEQLETKALLARNRGGCRELEDVSHFHVDLFGRYIPGLCSGLAVKAEDLGQPLDPDDYPLLVLLHREGIAGLLDHAREHFGFIPKAHYLCKCHLCLDIRSYLVSAPGTNYHELSPMEFYENL